MITAVSDPEVVRLDSSLIFIGYAQCAIFVLQLIVFGFQARMLQKTVKAAADQSTDIKGAVTHLGEAAGQLIRAANAMEISAKAVTVASQAAVLSTNFLPKQMRAYLSVRIGVGVYQVQAIGVRFEVKPMLINTGLTPARKVCYSAKASVLTVHLADDFVFPPLDPPRSIFGLLAPQQNMIMNAMVEGDFFDDGEVEDIKRGQKRKLYIWGTVFYENVFEEPRYTNFAHSIFWVRFEDGSEPVLGHYADRHNEAT